MRRPQGGLTVRQEGTRVGGSVILRQGLPRAMLVTEKDEPLLRRHRRGAAPLVVYLILFFVVWSLRATVFFHFDQKFESPLSKAVYSNTLKLVIWVLPAVVYLKWRAGERPLQYLK